MTPLLILLFGIHPVTASGTLVTGLHRTVAWRVTGLLAAGSLPAAGATLALVSRMGLQDQAASTMIRAVLAAVLLLTALSLVARRNITVGTLSYTGPLLSASRPVRAQRLSCMRSRAGDRRSSAWNSQRPC